MDALINWFNHTDPSIIVLVVMSAMVALVVWSWHRDRSASFNLQQVLIDSVTGKIAIEKVGYMTALAIATWGFVTMILRGHMTEWYFTAYLGVFALARLGSQGLAVWRDVNKDGDHHKDQADAVPRNPV